MERNAINVSFSYPPTLLAREYLTNIPMQPGKFYVAHGEDDIGFYKVLPFESSTAVIIIHLEVSPYKEAFPLPTDTIYRAVKRLWDTKGNATLSLLVKAAERAHFPLLYFPEATNFVGSSVTVTYSRSVTPGKEWRITDLRAARGLGADNVEAKLPVTHNIDILVRAIEQNFG